MSSNQIPISHSLCVSVSVFIWSLLLFLPDKPHLSGDVLYHQCGASDAGTPADGEQDHKYEWMCSPNIHIYHLGTDRLLPAGSHDCDHFINCLLPAASHFLDEPSCLFEIGCIILDPWDGGGVSSDHLHLHSLFLRAQMDHFFCDIMTVVKVALQIFLTMGLCFFFSFL